MRHSPSPPNPSATGSLTQEAFELRYLLLINEKGIRGAAGWWCCSSTNPTLDVYQAISHNCHYGSVSAEHPRCKRTRTLPAVTDVLGKLSGTLVSNPKAVLKISSDKVK